MATSPTSPLSHPCFGIASRQKVGRLHLPVAPRANSRIRFASSAPVGPAMTPEDALAMLGRVVSGGTSVGIVGITGPGDPLAAPEATLRTLRLVREAYPEMALCLTTVGLGGSRVAEELAAIGLSHVTVLVDAVSPEVAEKIYAWIRPSTRTVPLAQAAQVLVEEQRQAVSAFVQAGLTVKINTAVYPGFNAGHVEQIASEMAALGASIMAVVPFVPEGDGEDMPAESGPELLATVRDRVGRHIELMAAWEECGAEVVGTERPAQSGVAAAALPKPTPERPNVAVASSNGMEVDLHLGHAHKLLIYGPREDGLACLLGTREAPEPGSGSQRWDDLADILKDCFVLLAASAGENPRQILSRRGMPVLVTDGEIEGTVDVLYGGGKKGKGRKK
jgi:nitrogen fixation protein NifB